MNKYQYKKNYYVSIKKQTNNVPFTCPLCTLVMSTYDDISSYKLYECCSWCERMWVRGKETQWKNGWRPDDAVIKLTIKGLGIIR